MMQFLVLVSFASEFFRVLVVFLFLGARVKNSPKPIRGGGKTDTARTDGNGENLADADPSARTPGASKED
jgi:hypothetical protein